MQETAYKIGRREYPRVTAILHSAGLYEWIGHIPPAKLRISQDFGTAVHLACQYHDEDRLGEVDERVNSYLNGWVKLRKDMKWGKEIILTETQVHSNLWGYAGTPDRLFKGNILVDIKSGQVSPVVGLQTIAYAKAVEEFMGIKVKQRFAVQLMPNDYRLTEFKNASDWDVFVACLKIHNFKEGRNLI